MNAATPLGARGRSVIDVAGHIAVVELLLKAGANVNHQGVDWGTPLQEATDDNQPEAARLLAAAGGRMTGECKGNPVVYTV